MRTQHVELVGNTVAIHRGATLREIAKVLGVKRSDVVHALKTDFADRYRARKVDIAGQEHDFFLMRTADRAHNHTAFLSIDALRQSVRKFNPTATDLVSLDPNGQCAAELRASPARPAAPRGLNPLILPTLPSAVQAFTGFLAFLGLDTTKYTGGSDALANALHHHIHGKKLPTVADIIEHLSARPEFQGAQVEVVAADAQAIHDRLEADAAFTAQFLERGQITAEGIDVALHDMHDNAGEVMAADRIEDPREVVDPIAAQEHRQGGVRSSNEGRGDHHVHI